MYYKILIVKGFSNYQFVIILCYIYELINAENIYDEPSQPDPVYQEINTERTTDKSIEMMENSSYITTSKIADYVTVLEECPAYVRHQDVHCL